MSPRSHQPRSTAVNPRMCVSSDRYMYGITSCCLLVVDAVLGLGSFVEPCYVVYDIENPRLSQAVAEIRRLIPLPSEGAVVQRCREQRIKRVGLWDEATEETVSPIHSHASVVTDVSADKCHSQHRPVSADTLEICGLRCQMSSYSDTSRPRHAPRPRQVPR